MTKIHCLNPIAKCGTELFPAGYEMTDNVADADAVLVRSASMHDMELPENLLAVGRAGAGVNNIPLDSCAQKGIVVFNTPGANANGVVIMSFPKGDNAKAANLKCCKPKGIPMIVIHNIAPKTKWDRQIQMPPKNIHRIFINI